MTLLQIFFIISGIIILILSLDIAKKQKFNALHFLVFIWVWLGLLWFTFFPAFLDYIGSFFWVQRWADLLVYSAIIFLLYFVILLLNKIEQQKEDFTKLVREIAISTSPRKRISGKICFVIAAYNEENVVASTIDNLLSYKNSYIIVTNDGSNDQTQEILEAYWNKIIVLRHYKNRWQWAALETGFEYIRRFWDVEYVCTFDADGQHQLSDLSNFLNEFENNSDLEVILWSRFITQTWTNISLLRKIILKLGVLFTFFISNINLTDAHNWYRVMRKSALRSIRITMDGMWHASEIVDIISQKNIKFKEVPVNILYTDYSRSKWQKSSNAINIALKTIWYKFFK